jgi:hypothetical protein
MLKGMPISFLLNKINHHEKTVDRYALYGLAIMQ